MTKEKSAMRQALEAAIGNYEVITRPDGLVHGKWGANEQADAVASRVRVSVGHFHVMRLMGTDNYLMPLSAHNLRSELTSYTNVNVLEAGVKVLAEQAGVNPHTVTVLLAPLDGPMTPPVAYIKVASTNDGRALHMAAAPLPPKFY
jgi:precorrin isomerase